MANARQIIEKKNGQLVSIGPEATVLEAAQLMNEHRIGSLVVIAEGELVGIFTERDVMMRVVAEHKDPAATPVQTVMTTTVACATPETAYSELCTVVREKRIRHLPVVEDGKVLGMISIGDLNRVDHETQESTIHYLKQYISVS